MSSISLLPLYRVTSGVQPDEDWTLAFAFYLADGLTPISLAGIGFTATLRPLPGGVAIYSSGANFAISGAANNILTLTVLAAAKAGWGLGAYALTILAADGVYDRDLLANSTLTVGAPQTVSATPIVAAGGAPTNLMAFLPPAVALALTAATPAVMAAGLAALSSGQLAALSSALVQALPNFQTNGGVIPAAGLPFINASGFVVIAQ